MTRNTKFYRASFITPKGASSIIFRTLTIEELACLSGIKNPSEKSRMAGELSILDKTDLSWPMLSQIGENAIKYSIQAVEDSELFELTVREFREKVLKDPVLLGLTHILQLFPGQSVTDLMKLTHLDIIELICFGEVFSSKQIFQVSGFKSVPKKGMRLAKSNAETKQSLQDKMNQLNGFMNG
jgi:CRP-like cAMP-binding protein